MSKLLSTFHACTHSQSVLQPFRNTSCVEPQSIEFNSRQSAWYALHQISSVGRHLLNTLSIELHVQCSKRCRLVGVFQMCMYSYRVCICIFRFGICMFCVCCKQKKVVIVNEIVHKKAKKKNEIHSQRYIRIYTF